MSKLAILLSVLLPKGTHGREDPEPFRCPSIIPHRHKQVVDSRTSYHPSVVERLATRDRTEQNTFAGLKF